MVVLGLALLNAAFLPVPGLFYPVVIRTIGLFAGIGLGYASMQKMKRLEYDIPSSKAFETEFKRTTIASMAIALPLGGISAYAAYLLSHLAKDRNNIMLLAVCGAALSLGLLLAYAAGYWRNAVLKKYGRLKPPQLPQP